MKLIILDTNFLLIPAQFNIDIFAEIRRICDFNYELAVLDKTIEELKLLAQSKEKKVSDRRAAKLGLQLLEAKKIKVIKTTEDKTVDTLLVNSKASIIATQDMELKRRLKKNNIKIITLRAKKKLILI